MAWLTQEKGQCLGLNCPRIKEHLTNIGVNPEAPTGEDLAAIDCSNMGGARMTPEGTRACGLLAVARLVPLEQLAIENPIEPMGGEQ